MVAKKSFSSSSIHILSISSTSQLNITMWMVVEMVIDRTGAYRYFSPYVSCCNNTKQRIYLQLAHSSWRYRFDFCAKTDWRTTHEVMS